MEPMGQAEARPTPRSGPVAWKEFVFGAVLVAVLFVLAGFYAWRQVRLLRRLRGAHGLSDAEARWRRGQAWRRLVGSALMLGLAAFVWAALAMEPQAQRLADAGPAADTPENREFVRVYGGVVIAVLLLLLALLGVVAVDLWSTRRFSVSEHRKILDDKRAMIQREVAKIRQQRNGHG
jgi:hypothetical protein